MLQHIFHAQLFLQPQLVPHLMLNISWASACTS